MTQVLESRLAALIAADAAALNELRTARALALPCWALAGGWVRNRIWDSLTGYRTFAPDGDIDLVYFDPADPRPQRDWSLDAALQRRFPWARWQVRNQARMHEGKGQAPYRDLADALAHWLETATAVGVRLAGDRLELVAPRGLDDLFALTLRATPTGRAHRDRLRARIQAKGWCRRWPGLRIVID
jgi:hypothetical protein